MSKHIFAITLIAIIIVLFASTLATTYKECSSNGGTPVRGVFWLECVPSDIPMTKTVGMRCIVTGFKDDRPIWACER